MSSGLAYRIYRIVTIGAKSVSVHALQPLRVGFDYIIMTDF